MEKVLILRDKVVRHRRVVVRAVGSREAWRTAKWFNYLCDGIMPDLDVSIQEKQNLALGLSRAQVTSTGGAASHCSRVQHPKTGLLRARR